MVRIPLTSTERERGRRLGQLLRNARGEESMVEIAARAGLSAETVRKIETGRAPTPSFFTIAALAGALGISLDTINELLAPSSCGSSSATAVTASGSSVVTSPPRC